MNPHYYICYHPEDGIDFAEQLYAALSKFDELPKPWLDTHYSFETVDYQEFIGYKIRSSDALIFVMTPKGIESKVCKLQWLHALEHRIPVVPIRFDSYSDLPYRLEPRTPINLGLNFDKGIERLVKKLKWLQTSEGIKETLEFVISDATFALSSPYADKTILTERIKFCETLIKGLTSKTEIIDSWTVTHNKHAFISYSHKDTDIMQKLKTVSIKHGVRIWNDEHLNPGDESWKKEIETAIEQAGCVIAILSPEAKNSKWVGLELSYAEIHNIRVFPILVRGDEAHSVPIQLISTQRNSLKPESNIEIQLDEFVIAIQSYLRNLSKVVTTA